MCCENKNNIKSGISKINHHKIVFSYTDKPITLNKNEVNEYYKQHPHCVIENMKQYRKLRLNK